MYEQAAEAYRRAIDADPDFADAHCNLGSVYFNRGRRDLARDCFERAVAIQSGHVEANLNLGTIRDVPVLREVEWTNGTSFYFHDPDGNLLEICNADIWPV